MKSPVNRPGFFVAQVANFQAGQLRLFGIVFKSYWGHGRPLPSVASNRTSQDADKAHCLGGSDDGAAKDCHFELPGMVRVCLLKSNSLMRPK
jgi:hypothetical protein